jgi:transposase
MGQKNEKYLGQVINGKTFFTDEEKLIIIEDYLSSNESVSSVYYRYTGKREEHGRILTWMRKLGIKRGISKNITLALMSQKKKEIEPVSTDFEVLQLKKRVEELEQKLRVSEMKAVAFSTMVDIAEKEFNIPIRKKYNTKP